MGRGLVILRRDCAQAIGEKAQGALGGNGRIELAHGTGGGVARVHKGFFTLFPGSNAIALALVQSFKVVAAHVDLATHLQHIGYGRCAHAARHRNAQRNLRNGADIGRHVLASFTVAAGGGLHQHTVFVAQVHGQTVKLQFGAVLHRRIVFREAQFFTHPRVKGFCTAGFGVGFGADAEHGHGMAHRGKGVQRPPPHPLRRRIAALPMWMRFFQRLELFEQSVVFGIRNTGGVEHVVLVGIALQQRNQCFHAVTVCATSRFGRLKQVSSLHGGSERIRKTNGEPAPNLRQSHAFPAWRTGPAGHGQCH